MAHKDDAGNRKKGTQVLSSVPVTSPSPHAAMMQLITGYLNTQVVGTLARLGVADALSLDNPRPVAEVAAEVDADPHYLNRLMRTAASKGLLQSREGGYVLTPAGAMLQAGHPHSVKHMAMVHSMPGHYSGMSQLYHAVLTGHNCFEHALGKPNFWEYLQGQPEENIAFNDFMTELTELVAAPCAAAYDFGRHSSVVDVGGGHGRLLREVLHTHPGVAQGIVFDLPPVVGTAPLVAEVLQERLSFAAGDMFTDAVPIGDAYMMKAVLHDWGDEDCVRILNNIKSSMQPGAKIIDYDMIMPASGDAPHLAKEVDLVMMNVAHGGKERTEHEWQQLFGAAGLKVESINEVPGTFFNVIVASLA